MGLNERPVKIFRSRQPVAVCSEQEKRCLFDALTNSIKAVTPAAETAKLELECYIKLSQFMQKLLLTQ